MTGIKFAAKTKIKETNEMVMVIVSPMPELVSSHILLSA
jgi:hypothetical protein